MVITDQMKESMENQKFQLVFHPVAMLPGLPLGAMGRDQDIAQAPLLAVGEREHVGRKALSPKPGVGLAQGRIGGNDDSERAAAPDFAPNPPHKRRDFSVIEEDLALAVPIPGWVA